MVPEIWYVFKIKNLKYFFLSQKESFSFFSQTSKSGWDDGDSDVDGHGENFLIENFVENEMAHSQHIYRRP